MTQNTIIKRAVLSVAAILLALFAMGFFIPLRGEWVDRIISDLLSRQLNLEVNCDKTCLVRWSEVSFDNIKVGLDGRPALEGGKGIIYLQTKPFLIFRLNDIRLNPQGKLPSVPASLPIFKGMEGELQIQTFLAGLSGNRKNGFLHIFECVSDDFDLKGGLKWEAGRAVKAHFYFSLSPERSKKMPKEISKRLIVKEGGWTAVRLIYGHNELTLLGPKGPLFQAKWAGQL